MGYICSHIETLFENIDLVKSFFPDFFDSTEESDEEDEQLNYNMHMIKDVNNEDDNVHTEINDNFNIQTGLWEYPAILQHKPLDMMGPHLVNETGKHNEYAISSKLNADTGLYGVYDLMASTMNDDGTDKKCLCGITYHKQGILKEKGTLYTRNGPVQIKYYDIFCQRGLCTIPFTAAAKEKGVFIFTHASSAGDEIGWDFIHSVLRTKCSFTAYCNEM